MHDYACGPGWSFHQMSLQYIRSLVGADLRVRPAFYEWVLGCAWPEGQTHGSAPQWRLRACSHREVRVLSRHTLQPVTDCNRVVVRRGGEQQEVNDQSVG